MEHYPTPWSFDCTVAEFFDAHIRRSIPLYDVIHDLVVALSDEWIKTGSTICDVGTSTGEAICRLSKAYGDRKIRFCGIDSSEALLLKARQRTERINGVELLCAPIQARPLPRCDLITCLFTLQFIGVDERLPILAKMRRALNPGGALLLAEKTKAQDMAVEQSFRRCLEQFKLSQGFSVVEIEAKRLSLSGVMFPITINENLELLSMAGFRKAHVFAQWCDFVGIVAQ